MSMKSVTYQYCNRDNFLNVNNKEMFIELILAVCSSYKRDFQMSIC